MTPEQIASVVEEIREKVRSRHEKRVAEVPDFELPSLDPLGHSRDAALGKVAAIGTVNPRAGGFINNVIQAIKRTLARSLNWFVRDQVDFNRTVIDYIDRNLESQIEQNYNLLRVAKQVAHQMAILEAKSSEIEDLAKHWNAWRPSWEQRMNKAEVQFVGALRDIEATNRDRDSAFRQQGLKMHKEYLESLRKSAEEVQQRLWDDLSKLKAEQEHLIHTELRLIRRRAPSEAVLPAGSGAAAPVVTGHPQQEAPSLDYARFEERFRGSEKYVQEAQEFHLPHFRDCKRVLDLGCGRGEFLDVLRAAGIPCAGVDADADAVAACREKGLDVKHGDLFAFLERQAPGSVDGIFCAHVVEHLPPARVPELIALAEEKLAAGGSLAFETPNPACLAIFARDFYLDPSHVRPVPSNQLHFYLEEAGFVDLQVQELHQAAEVYSEIAALDQIEALHEFRKKFFGGLDYAIFGRKWKG